jgi:PIN domain nuclease of toxin-antitoxin system
LNLLLDTHIWLWSLLEPRRIGQRLQHELKDETNQRWLSPVSTWEAIALILKGRVRVPGNLTEWLEKALANFQEAPLTNEIVLATLGLSFSYLDPADRFLVATAQVLGLTLVTADERLLGLGEIATLANR